MKWMTIKNGREMFSAAKNAISQKKVNKVVISREIKIQCDTINKCRECSSEAFNAKQE